MFVAYENAGSPSYSSLSHRTLCKSLLCGVRGGMEEERKQGKKTTLFRVKSLSFVLGSASRPPASLSPFPPSSALPWLCPNATATFVTWSGSYLNGKRDLERLDVRSIRIGVSSSVTATVE